MGLVLYRFYLKIKVGRLGTRVFYMGFPQSPLYNAISIRE